MSGFLILVSIPLLFVVWFFIVKHLRKKGSGLIKANLLGWIGGTISSFILMTIGGSMLPPVETSEISNKESTTKTANQTASSKNIGSKEDKENKLTYTVTQDESLGKIKRSIEVLLPNRINEEDLRQIASELYQDGYDRTFMGYRIKDSKNEIYWATTHYDPDLNIRISGLDAKKFNETKNQNIEIDGELIGQWMIEWGVEHKASIYKKNNKIYLHALHGDGSNGSQLLSTQVTNNQTRFYDKNGKERGEYYIIGSDGNLQFWSAESGNYYSAPKI